MRPAPGAAAAGRLRGCGDRRHRLRRFGGGGRAFHRRRSWFAWLVRWLAAWLRLPASAAAARRRPAARRRAPASRGSPAGGGAGFAASNRPRRRRPGVSDRVRGSLSPGELDAGWPGVLVSVLRGCGGARRRPGAAARRAGLGFDLGSTARVAPRRPLGRARQACAAATEPLDAVGARLSPWLARPLAAARWRPGTSGFRRLDCRNRALDGGRRLRLVSRRRQRRLRLRRLGGSGRTLTHRGSFRQVVC